MRISFLIHNVYGVGGTNRAVINLASELAERHDVEIVSAFRRLDEPMLSIPGSVRVHPLVDLRPGSPDRDDPLQRRRSSITPGEEEFYAAYSQLTDARLREYLAGAGRDVYVGTRPALNLAVAHWGPAGAVLVAQEHQTHATVPAGIRVAMQAAYSRLAAAVTVTEADAEAFRRMTPVPGLRVTAVPNSSPAPVLPPSDTSGRVLLAAGRLDPVKQYDVLLHAFRSVVDRYPDWSLRIYGQGGEADRLRQLVGELRLDDHVLLMGRHARMETEWVKGAALVSSSERESFGMSIVEAMRAGLPVVSTRAPVGPEEIIADGEDGLLVPVGDVAALAKAMTTVIEDPVRRAEMGRRAQANAARFDPAPVARRYEALFEELAAPGRRPRAPRPWRQWVDAARSRFPARGRGIAEDSPASGPAVSITLLATGALEFRLPVEDGPWERLVVVRRRSEDQVAVALEASPGATGEVRGVLAPEVFLAEGRWDVHVERPDGARVRAVAGLCDTRCATALPLAQDGRPLARRLPYVTADDFLAVRAWLRPDHAEVDRVEQVEGVLRLTGRLVSQAGQLGDRLRVLAVSRVDGVPEWRSEATDTVGPDRFTVTVDLESLTAHRVTRHDDWDLYLEDVGTGGRARLGRLADDIADRKPVVRYVRTRWELETDPLMHEEWPVPNVELRPYFTVNNDLSLYVVER